ncbi:alpha/beta fold hydrolase [Dysosmobacter sp.]|uniref:alpha/beta fold hydrolase n=1 Tax=Dysosmobacter sp. TaxID=2591382 RepID=UPI002AA00345|nr:alpha/beta hydrolase [Dysosmobacter sp.]MDY5613225.1 alpha/beta hydrolase [Dysosmobacter sp.]
MGCTIHGRSRPYEGFSYSRLAEELKEILNAEQLEKVVLIGQSAGGSVAQSLIAKYPDMVEGLFTIGTCPYGPSYYSRSDLFWLR